MLTYEIINPSDAAHCDAPTDPIAVAAIALLSEGRYAVRRDGFRGPLFLFSGQEEWFAANAGGATFSDFTLANLDAIADVLASVRLNGERSSLNDFSKRAHGLAETLRGMAVERRAAGVAT